MTDLAIQSLFPPVSKAQWIQQVQADLKGKPFESLKQISPEGFETEPFYTPEDLDKQSITVNRAWEGRSPGWLNLPEVRFHSENTTNGLLRDELTKGANGLVIDLSQSDVDAVDFKHLLNGLKLSETPVWFRVNNQSEKLATALKAFPPYQLRGGIFDASLTRFLHPGPELDEALNPVAQATRLTLDSSQFRTITISSHRFHNAGATATQELAFTLGAVVDAFDSLTDSGLSIDQLVPKTALSVSVGTSYFTEIAKLRALRILWQRVAKQYHPTSGIQHPVFIHAQTSTFYDAAAMPYTNLLRATTEAMAAVIGGCDALTVHPYDAVLGESDIFSNRIARNVSILLKEEAHLDKTLDPAAGSYYLETLTTQLVDSTWALFLEVENRGGLQKAFAAGFVPEEIEKAYQAKVEAVKNGRILVGVTKFRATEESMSKTGTDTSKPVRSPKTLQVSLPDRRLAEEFE